MNDLDNQEIYQRLDPSKLRDRLRRLPEQCREASSAVTLVALPTDFRSVNRVVVAGMGGSAIGGDLLADLASLESYLPVTVWRDYALPRFVDTDTLVLACSYSGETEETLSTFRRAVTQGAKTVVITHGGTLGHEAQREGVPIVQIDYRGEPRTAIGYSFLAPLLLLASLNLIPDQSTYLAQAIGEMEQLLPTIVEETPVAHNPAKQLAHDLLGRLPVVYGGGIFGGVARRWKTQLNENAKVWAFTELLPEVDHNSVVGYLLPDDIRSQAFVALLRPQYLHPRTALRYQLTQELLHEAQIPYRVVDGQGDSGLSQVLTAVLLGDYTSYYLALLQGVDPSPVRAIDRIRERLASL